MSGLIFATVCAAVAWGIFGAAALAWAALMIELRITLVAMAVAVVSLGCTIAAITMRVPS